ncbi:MAG: MBL fold metallo-hydrolase [Kiritimatiellae bacterium]|nr:MBL fold metallo-hydrolase [Kiritimatiellia bacterium]
MTFIPIASSSSGNSCIIEQDGEAVLIDCGVSFKRVKAALGGLHLAGVLITHNHSDHVSGLELLLRRINAPVYANAATAEAVMRQEGVKGEAFSCFENGQEFKVGPFTVKAFPIPHDAADPVGFTVRGEFTYFHGTDIGTPLNYIGLQLAEAEVATLESNHDTVMLKTSSRAPSLKQRVGGPRGHLSNDQACELVGKFASARLRKLQLAHLSRECNAPHLALEAMRETLESIGRSDVELCVLQAV